MKEWFSKLYEKFNKLPSEVQVLILVPLQIITFAGIGFLIYFVTKPFRGY